MPKVVDYAARFAFLREAAFLVVRDAGSDALSLRRVATELGTPLATVRRMIDASASLPALAADQAIAEWRRAPWQHRPAARDAAPLDRATQLVIDLMPRTHGDLAPHLVWLKLSLSRTSVSRRATVPHEEGPLAARFQVADRGWSDAVADTHNRSSQTDEHLESRLADRDRHEEDTLRRALAHLGVVSPGDVERELPLLAALLHGLALDVCLGKQSVGEAQAATKLHLSRLPHAAPPETI